MSSRDTMGFLQTIAAKIFGLAVFLLVLTTALAGFLLFEVARNQAFLTVLARRDIPLTQSVSRIHEYGLRRRLAFERWFGALNAATPNAEVVSEATANHEIFTGKLHAEFKAARELIASYPKDQVGHDTLVEVATLLDQIEPLYPMISRRQREVLDLQLAGHHETANQILDALNDLQRTVQSQRELAQTKMDAMSLTVAATASTVLLGLVIASLITNRLTRPVRSLVGAMRDVREGNLDVKLHVTSPDEVVVGNIGSKNTRSYTVIGDTVNLTARVEGAKRIYGTRMLLAEATVRAAGHEIETREVDAIAVKGKTEPTRIFELLGAAGRVPDLALRLRDRYQDALRAYSAQDWTLAEAGFTECLELHGDDAPSALMLGRIAAFRGQPRDPGWDGVWQFSEK